MTGGMLGLAGSTGVAGAASNGGSLKITTNQMPSHYHTMTLISYSSTGDTQAHTYPQGANHGSLYNVTGADDINHPVGGGRTLYLLIPLSTVGGEPPKRVGDC